MTRPLAIDLFTGLHGWTDGLIAEGFMSVGVDIEDMSAKFGLPKPDHFHLIVQDVLTLHGSQFRDAALIVASPPCQFFSYTAMPWSRGKAIAAATRADPELLAKELALFRACFRIQHEACEAAGRHIPLVVENVRGAIPWVGRSRWNHGSYHLWGDVPALMPITLRRQVTKNGVAHKTDGTTNFHGHKNVIASVKNGDRVEAAGYEGLKVGGSWFGEGNDCSPMRQHSSKSSARKMASAMIAKIPEALSRHIASVYKPAPSPLFAD